MKRKRFALVGASGRGLHMYAMPLTSKYSETAELVALCDISQVRMDYVNKTISRSLPTYKDFDRMLKEVDFDCLIVTTQDNFHHEYVIRGLNAGKDVICEKPLTIDDEKCRAILRAEKKSGRKVIVTFNYRFAPPMTAIRRLLAAGTIGKVVTVDMHWPLDTSHGADYFRRWHRRRTNTGGLQVHKSTHHFDLINWFVQDEPVAVTAQGGLSFYGANGPFRSRRCMGCPHREKCQFYWDITANKYYVDFYVAPEKETGYIRDGCVFDEEIDIEDHFSLLVKYKGGAQMAYSLQAWSTWEGFRLEVQGTKGRLEYLELHSKHDWEDEGNRKIIVMLNDGSRFVHTPPKGIGGHGGGDGVLLRHLFGPKIDDPDGHMAGTKDAANSILVGVAATRSMQNNGAWARIPDLLKGK